MVDDLLHSSVVVDRFVVTVTSAVVCTAEFKFPGSVISKFKFPVSVVAEFKTDAVEEMIFMGPVGGGSVGGGSVTSATSRQMALTRRCVSRRWNRWPHFGHLVRRGMLEVDKQLRGLSKAVDR